jgi:hypothetical protein
MKVAMNQTPVAFGFVPPTIKNTKDVSKLTNLENYLYTPSEIAIVRKNHIANQKIAFEKQYNRSVKEAIKTSALAFSVPVLLALYVDKKGYSTNKSALIIASPLAISLLLMAVAPKWS